MVLGLYDDVFVDIFVGVFGLYRVNFVLLFNLFLILMKVCFGGCFYVNLLFLCNKFCNGLLCFVKLVVNFLS